jgi:hypothetical protein
VTGPTAQWGSGVHERGEWRQQVGPVWQRERGGGCARERAGSGGPNGREREVWAAFCFPFSSEFSIPFLFIFSLKFKLNQTTNSNLNISNMCIN